MTKNRPTTLVRLLLGVPLVLWFAVLLHVLRLSTAFNWLVKHLTPFVVFGAMTLCPLAAVILGRKLTREKESAALGRIAVITGAVLFLGFAIYPGVPLVKKKLGARTPRNPSHPTAVPAMTGLPVFPGAEGFGTRTRAGRGGKVFEVTTLADSGPGTLRAALEATEPRTVVFRIGGTIELAKPLMVVHPFLTVAGQTAPGGGICLKNASLVIATHDVLIQYLRVRPGDEGKVDADDNDAITILGSHGKVADGAANVVIDHVSASWAEDETISTWFGAHDITISWCIASEGLNRSRHHKGSHSTGILVGDGSDHVSIHHCLMAHNSFRHPLISKGGTHDVINNVVYDWGVLPAEIYDEDSNSFVNCIGNTFRRGPSAAEPGMYETIINSSGVPKLYTQGNRGPHRLADNADEWALVSFKWNQQVAPAKYRALERFATWPITTTNAEEAFDAVLTSAGATLPHRDAVDARIVHEVKAGAGRIIDSPKQVGGYPSLPPGTAPLDSDHDSIPDEWELAHQLDPKDPSDGSASLNPGGYTNLETYLHSLTR